MRHPLVLLAAGTALIAAPALAQLGADGVANVNLVGQVRANPADTVSGLTEPVGDTVERVDRTATKALDPATLTLATREQVRAGAEIHDSGGNSVGTVQSVDGGTAIVVRDGTLYDVPLSEIYHNAADPAHALVTRLPGASIKARASAGAAMDSR